METRQRTIPIHYEGSSKNGSRDDDAEFRVVDKRHFLDLAEQPLAGEPAEVKPRYPTYVEELMARVADTERRFSERVKLQDQEAARFRARLEADYERKLTLARQDIVLPFLEVLDNLERAIESAAAGGSHQDLIEGLRMTAGIFRAKVRAHAIEPIEVLNRPFDPAVSQAVGVVPTSEPERDGVVVDIVLPGYRMADNLVRPAQVRVAQYSGKQAGQSAV